jgi:hypothetical protein
MGKSLRVKSKIGIILLARLNSRLFEPLRAWFIVKYYLREIFPWASMMSCPASSYIVPVGSKSGRDASEKLARLPEGVA